MRLLLNQNSGDEGGSGQGQGDGGQQAASSQGQGQGQGANQGKQGIDGQGAKADSTAKRLWGDLVDVGKAGTQQGKTEGQSADAGQGDQGQQGQQGQQGGQAPQGGEHKIELTKEILGELAKTIGDSVKTATQQNQPAQQLTQEEFDKMFNIYRPTPDLWKALRGEDEATAVEALTAMLHGASKQATTIASHLIAHEVKQIQQLLQPAIQMAQERQMEQMKEEFFKEHTDLKGYEPLLVLIRDQFVAKGMNFPTKEAAFKAVAEEARKHIEKIPGLRNGAGGQPNAGQQNNGQPGRQMPTLSGGKGQSGAGDGGQTSGGHGKKNTAERIFG